MIGETIYSGLFEDYSYYLNPLNNDPGLGGAAFGVGKTLEWTALVVGGGYAAGSPGAAAISAGAELAGTTMGTYLGIQAGLGAVETAIEVRATSYFGGDVSFSGTAATFGKNFAVDALTGGVGGFFTRQAIEIGADTALDIARGQDALSSLAYNAIGSVAGEALGRGIGAFHRNFEIRFDATAFNVGGLGGISIQPRLFRRISSQGLPIFEGGLPNRRLFERLRGANLDPPNTFPGIDRINRFTAKGTSIRTIDLSTGRGNSGLLR